MLRRFTGVPARLAILVVGIAAAVVGGATECPEVSVGAAAISGLVMLAQFLGAGPSVVAFTKDDWKEAGEDQWVLEISWRRHLRVCPKAALFVANADGTMEEWICDVKTRDDTVLLYITRRPDEDTRITGEARIS